jgi:hypothetical protein
MVSLHTNQFGNQITLDLVTLDSIKLDRINGMKIDVEGHELDVNKGAMQTLKKHKPWFVIELNNSFNNIQSISQWKVLQILTEIGYKTNFDSLKKIDTTFCRDIIFFNNTNSNRELLRSFL